MGVRLAYDGGDNTIIWEHQRNTSAIAAYGPSETAEFGGTLGAPRWKIDGFQLEVDPEVLIRIQMLILKAENTEKGVNSTSPRSRAEKVSRCLYWPSTTITGTKDVTKPAPIISTTWTGRVSLLASHPDYFHRWTIWNVLPTLLNLIQIMRIAENTSHSTHGPVPPRAVQYSLGR
ncbi:hypothetical protein J6590_052856 [Homalodisca vitripennis]|nr:hypothetical protein J6590_052856 [Homalodisca vitripennis]